jgi:2-(1,2-epoxy-1,2-dihydrophenyl)acetyl-CoA isomerase
VREIEQASVGAVLLCGSPPAFCAGGDIVGMGCAGDRADFLHTLSTELNVGLVCLAGMPVPVVAAVEGAVAGAGLGLALTADLVIAGSSARLSTSFAGVGLSPDSGVSYILPRTVGLGRALQMCLTGRVLTAAEALSWGIVTEVVPDDTAADRGYELARRLAVGPHPAIVETKRLLRTADRRGYIAHLEEETQTIARTGVSDDSVRLIDAFLARRAGTASTGRRT